MDEIILLQKQLAQVQAQDKKLLLSEHNAIDILQKLQELRKIQIIYTKGRTDFLTPDRLEREVYELIIANDGRISYMKLQYELNIDVSYIYTALNAIVLKNPHVETSNGMQTTYIFYVIAQIQEVVTNSYLDAITEEINMQLQIQGFSTVGELSQQYDLPVEYMRDVLRNRLGTILHAYEQGNTIYTTSYRKTQEARVRGVFMAATVPVFLHEIAKDFQLDLSLLQNVLSQLIDTNQLHGTLRGIGKLEYCPNAYFELQKQSLIAYFRDNGYVSHARINDIGCPRPIEILEQAFPTEKLVHLESCIAGKAFQLRVEGAIDAVKARESAVMDIRTIVPSTFTVGDIDILIGACETHNKKLPFIIVNRTYVVHMDVIDQLKQMFQDHATLRAQELMQTIVNSDNIYISDDGIYEGGQDSYKKKSTPRKPKSNEKKSRIQETTRNVSDNINSSDDKNMLPPYEAIDDMIENFREGIFASDIDLIQAIHTLLQSELKEMYEGAFTLAKTVFTGDTAAFRLKQTDFEQVLEDQRVYILTIEKGFRKLENKIQIASNTESISSSSDILRDLETYILETICADLVMFITNFIATTNSITLENVEMETMHGNLQNSTDRTRLPSRKSLSDINQEILEERLSPSVYAALFHLWSITTTEKQSISNFVDALQNKANELGLLMRKVDRKKERQAIQIARQSRINEFETCLMLNASSTHNNVLRLNDIVALTMELLVQQATNFPIALPRSDENQYVSLLLTALVFEQNGVEQEIKSTMETFLHYLENQEFDREKWLDIFRSVQTIACGKNIMTKK